ncbi:MAG: nitroreductase family protein [Acidobacteriia bacterium]|nr:nitroreductase family protein [Terriglobia bacterium]
MELTDVILNRRAVREYTNAAIDRATVERLIEAAVLAPSAMNLQPWAFAVLLDRDRIEGYAKRAKEWLLASLSQSSYDPSIRHMLEDPKFALFYHAPALVVVLAKSSGTQAAEDCCLAAENLMLAARNEGLGTCWIGFARPWLDMPATKADLKVPEHYHVVAPIVLGHPKAWPESHGRKPAEIHWLR